MFQRQQSSFQSFRVGPKGRLIAGAVFLAVAGAFAVLYWGEQGNIDWEALLKPCGFKQRHRLPCPACGMTASIRAFARGEIGKSLVLQPAGGVLGLALAATALAGLYIAATGRGARLLSAVRKWKARYVLLIVFAVALMAWAVTLARAMMASY